MIRGRRGLTLIELVIVMAIMVILASISFVSIQYVVNKNAVKKIDANCIEAIELCVTNANLLNQGVGTVGGTTINSGANVTPTNFRQMIETRISKEYDIQIRTANTAPTQAAGSKDLIVVYISGLNQPLNRQLNLQVRGAWYIKKGTSTPVYTYNYVTRVATESSVNLTAP